MAINPYEPKSLERLVRSIRWSRERLRRFRTLYRKLIEQFVTENYSEDLGVQPEVVVNLLGMAVDTDIMHLAPSQPNIHVSTDFREYQPVAHDFEVVLNKDLKQLGLERVMREVVTDAWFSMGICKIFMSSGNEIDLPTGERIDIGDLRLESVSIDNWVHDCSARKWGELAFMGDLRCERMYDVRTSGRYENLETLGPYAHNNYDYHESGEERVANLSTEGTSRIDSPPVDMVYLWDIFLPREQLLVTLPRFMYTTTAKPLRVIEWQGPTDGPYLHLCLNEVPENIVGVSPGILLRNLHDLANNLFRKLRNQAKRQKFLTAVEPGAEDDVKHYRDASDGDIIAVSDPSSIQQIAAGGIDQVTNGFAIQVMDLFDQHAGNMRMRGGLSQSADTLGQEQILQQQSSVRTEKQKGYVLNLAERIAKQVAWYRWHDDFFNPRFTVQFPELDMEVEGRFGPDDRLGRWIDYNFDIEPYSMQYTTPAQKSTALIQLLQNIVLPMMPLLQQQGIGMDFEKLMKTLARHLNLPELVDILQFNMGEQVLSPPPMDKSAVARPPSTTRNYVRTNRPGSSRVSNDRILARSLMGAPNQQTEMDSLYRGQFNGQ